MKNLKIFTSNIEQEAVNQINELLEQDAFKNSKIRIMPDVHAGKGCVIGFTGNLGNKVIPSITGVDIGCGMLCVELGKSEIDLAKLDEVIRKYVPSGRNVHEKINNKLYFNNLKCFSKLNNKDNWLDRSLGTLGGGNHFIEIDIDNENNKFLIIHTGSRNLGKQVAEIYQNEAIEYCSYKEEMKQEKENIIKEYKATGREKEIQSKLIEISNKYKDRTKLPKDLCYLEGEDRENYLHDMAICQKFASYNRASIANIILEKMNLGTLNNLPNFQTIHNYISFEDNIVRKGAISAKKGERVLIPINMRDGCIIGIGKGNDDWNQSAPHGAGRIMSRMAAKETISMEDYKNSMKNIYTTSVSEDTIDESPFAYKPMEEILENIKDTIDIDIIVKPIYNFKASE